MKRLFALCISFIIGQSLFSQDYYWVFFTDKSGCEFDPYEYFDEKAIQRRITNGISLCDETDFPLNNQYKEQTLLLCEELIGETRWFNAIAVAATDDNINKIAHFPFVSSVQLIASKGVLAAIDEQENEGEELPEDNTLFYNQLLRMGGDEFVKNGIDGKGIRIAIFDGGFPGVNTHPCFQHLRAHGQIIKTWNFPKKKEDVYGWNSHGTMVLSCIAGKNGNQLMGLATGSEFLLARTEINIEPKMEEVWWMQAVEWADKNGADVINSSLGYGKARYNTQQMDGTSLVSRAANMAAAKGMLVCNSMGNEADDDAWRVLITPADADSVLSVGGINPNNDRRIYFSSFGPTSDGRMKPNVCAFGKAWVANPNGTYQTAFGTSFSSPLVAGFAACAWQTRPGYTAMQMKEEIERSGDRYPYYDYAYGFGVPQAAYFLNDKGYRKNVAPTLELVETADNTLFIHILNREKNEEAIERNGGIYSLIEPKNTEDEPVLCHIEGCSGQLKYYWQIDLRDNIEFVKIFPNTISNGDIIRLSYKGYFFESKYQAGKFYAPESTKGMIRYQIIEDKPATQVYKTSAFGANAKVYIHPYLAWGFATPPFDDSEYGIKYASSQSLRFGFRFFGNICKWYKLGVSIDVAGNWYSLRNFKAGISRENITHENEKVTTFTGEFYQRFRFIPTEGIGLGLYFDTGIYGSCLAGARYLLKYEPQNKEITIKEKNKALFTQWQWGVRARLGYEIIAIYAQYRISDFLQEKKDFPKLECGIELSIPLGL
ncbi:MAG: S8 family serine peptidase [Bacteroidales bacterium]|nr:S8 family serine peptidase [Bacteroidales bacterium]